MSQTLPCRVEGVGETACLAGHHSSPTYAHKHGSMIQAWLRLFPQCSTQLWQQLRADSPMKHVYIFKGAWTRFKRPPLASPQALASGSVSPVQCPVSPGSTSHSAQGPVVEGCSHQWPPPFPQVLLLQRPHPELGSAPVPGSSKDRLFTDEAADTVISESCHLS